jgi:hypothetical protein
MCRGAAASLATAIDRHDRRIGVGIGCVARCLSFSSVSVFERRI